jgi:hypothetical protein
VAVFTQGPGLSRVREYLGASEFLLPQMLQLGFGLSPMTSGLLTMATALGSLSTRTITTVAMRRLGFRRLLVGATIFTTLFYGLYGQFRPTTSHVLIFCTLILGGLFNGLAMVTLNAIGYAEIPKARMSHATTLASMAQQLSVSLGVAIGAELLSLTAWSYASNVALPGPADFMPAFTAVGCMTLISVMFFTGLPKATMPK